MENNTNQTNETHINWITNDDSGEAIKNIPDEAIVIFRNWSTDFSSIKQKETLFWRDTYITPPSKGFVEFMWFMPH